MAALTITVAQVLPGSIDAGADFFQGIAAETITAGQAVHVNASNLVALGDANVSALTATLKGVALHGALTGQPIRAQSGGPITLGAGAAPVVGTIYVGGATPGTIHPAADLATGWYVSILGVGATGNKLNLSINNSGQLVP